MFEEKIIEILIFNFFNSLFWRLKIPQKKVFNLNSHTKHLAALINFFFVLNFYFFSDF